LFFSASLWYILYQLLDFVWAAGFTSFIFYIFGGDVTFVLFMVGLVSWCLYILGCYCFV
jgi:hypothetical protein